MLFAALGWFVVTCASDPQAAEKFKEIIGAASPLPPTPTPLPAQPIGSMARTPSAGEPPVGVFDEEDLAQMDALPVGASTPTPPPQAPSNN
ncbi:MAG: hypothetical protein M5R36_12440 [Deltaproteobacteria bacterium]|nr:hypothetical protein [Deltaproteobacteria bacterium]